MGSITNRQQCGRTRRQQDMLMLWGGLASFGLALVFVIWGAVRSAQGFAAVGWLIFMGCLVLPGLGWYLTARGARAIPVQIRGRWYAWGTWMSGSLLMLLGLLLFLIAPKVDPTCFSTNNYLNEGCGDAAYGWWVILFGVIDLVWGFVLLLVAAYSSLPKWVWLTLLVTPLVIAGVVGLIVSIIEGGLY